MQHTLSPENKQITVLFTRYHSKFSTFIYYITGRRYTHTSIGIDNSDEFYGFTLKGFKKEHPKYHKTRGKKSLAIRITVPDDKYQIVVDRLEEIEKAEKKYKYSTLGVFLCLLRIPFVLDGSYFCSQFVAEVLLLAGIMQITKHPSLYLPNHLCDELMDCQLETEIIYDYL